MIDATLPTEKGSSLGRCCCPRSSTSPYWSGFRCCWPPFSFSDVTAGDPSFDWNGLANYRQIFDDPVFWQSLRNTIIFTAGSMVLIVVFGKVLANILVADFHGKWIVRFLVLLPWTTPVALSAIAWLWMLDSIFSPIDWMLRQVGLIDGNMYWLGRPNPPCSVIAVHAWRLISVGCRHHDGRAGRNP